MFSFDNIQKAERQAKQLMANYRGYELNTRDMKKEFNNLYKIVKTYTTYTQEDLKSLIIYRLNTLFKRCDQPEIQTKVEDPLDLSSFQNIQEIKIAELFNNLCKPKQVAEKELFNLAQRLCLPWVKKVEAIDNLGYKTFILELNTDGLVGHRTDLIVSMNYNDVDVGFLQDLTKLFLENLFDVSDQINIMYTLRPLRIIDGNAHFWWPRYNFMPRVRLVWAIYPLVNKVENFKMTQSNLDYIRDTIDEDHDMNKLFKMFSSKAYVYKYFHAFDNSLRDFVKSFDQAWENQKAYEFVCNLIQKSNPDIQIPQVYQNIPQVYQIPQPIPQVYQIPQISQIPQIPQPIPQVYQPITQVYQPIPQVYQPIPQDQVVAQRFREIEQEDGKTRTPIKGRFNNMKIPETLEESLKEVAHLISDLEIYILTANEQADDLQIANLTKAMKAALIIYTMQMGTTDNSLFHLVNKVLREKDRTLINPWTSYIFLLMHALKRLNPCLETDLYRGTNKSLAELSEKYQPGQTFTWQAFSSTSTSMNGAAKFLGNGDRVFWLLKLKEPFYGRSLVKFSEFPNEQEVLLPPNMRFKVIEITKMGPGLHLIRCDQEPIIDNLIGW